MPALTKKRAKWIGVTALVTALIGVIALNLGSGETRVIHVIEHRYGVRDPQFARTLGALLGPGLVPGNKVTPLQNGDQIFPAMLAAIQSARKTVCFETYIYWSGDVGRRFSEALIERARAGIRVHVLLDWVGTGKMDSTLIEQMKAVGVEVEKYHPLRWYTVGRVNNRTHRKLLIVDGTVGFTGGVGIADLWSGNGEDADHWRDAHFRLEGPAVAQMQSAFMDNWIKSHARVNHDGDYFPSLEPRGDMVAQVFKSSAREGSESVRLMFLMAIAAATQTISIESAYFVPDDLSVAMLVAARERGVRVEILVPGKITDSRIVGKASRARWGPLLKAGVLIHEYVPTMLHEKVMIIDGLFVTVGSTNFDNRSFRLNDEANLNVWSEDLARQLTAVFEADKARSTPYTLEMWQGRSWAERFGDWTAALVRAQL